MAKVWPSHVTRDGAIDVWRSWLRDPWIVSFFPFVWESLVGQSSSFGPLLLSFELLETLTMECYLNAPCLSP